MRKITSRSNPLIKEVLHIREKNSYRKKSKKFIVEGLREINLALQGGYFLETVFFVPEILKDKSVLKNFPEKNLIEISSDIYAKIAYRESTEGIIAVGRQKDLGLEAVSLPSNPLVLVAEGIEKPGNIGAMLRTADAAGIDAFILANPKTDFYNPNVIRSSVGTVFTVNIATGTTAQIVDFLKKHNIRLFAATLQNANPYYDENFVLPTAIAVGTEATGLSQEMRYAAFKNIIIPMNGKIDSMNVSVSAAILIFEAVRQRHKKFSK